MKRNINLQELSRDHHHGLLLGWKIRKGLQTEVPESSIADYVRFFWDRALAPHFSEEEELILRFLSDNDEFKQRTLLEHQAVQDRVKNLNTKDDLLGLATLLDNHIRFEERELFPYLESLLTENQLEKIGESIATSHHPYTENYPNEFWKK